MNDLLLCKPGEIFLKGLNKHYFEERLVANVKRRLKPIGHFRVTYLQSALYIEAADDAADLDAAYDAVRKVFGHRDDHARGRLREGQGRHHGARQDVPARRDDGGAQLQGGDQALGQALSHDDIELSRMVGGPSSAEAFPNTVVDVHDPELTVRLEVREQAAYVHAQAVEAAAACPSAATALP